MTSHVGGMRPGMHERTAESAWVAGGTAVAAVLMIFGGIMAIFAGISAIAKDDVFVTTHNYTFSWSLTSWGWTHLILGIVIALAGFALFSGAMWARVVGIVVAGLGMIANFAWLPYTPVWSIVLLIVDGFIIWALCTPRRAAQP